MSKIIIWIVNKIADVRMLWAKGTIELTYWLMRFGEWLFQSDAGDVCGRAIERIIREHTETELWVVRCKEKVLKKRMIKERKEIKDWVIKMERKEEEEEKKKVNEH